MHTLNEKSLLELPSELLTMIFRNLNQRDIASVDMVCKTFHSVISFMHKGAFYLSAINNEIAALGYKHMKFTNTFIGLPTAVEQCNFLNLLRKHKDIRDRLDLFEKIDLGNHSISLLREDIGNLEKTIETTVLKIVVDNDLKNKDADTKPEILYLESCLQSHNQEFSYFSPAIFNPIMLRMYVEVLRISAIISDPNSTKNDFLYKKLFLASILLLKVGDVSAYFSLVDLTSMAISQKHNILPFIKKRFKTSKKDNEFLDELIEEAFVSNGINIKTIKSTNGKTAFLKKFNYKLAFFYPQTTLTLLSDLLGRYGDTGLIAYYHIGNGLLKCFDIAYRQLFLKIFDDDAISNLTLLEKEFETSSLHSTEVLLTMSKHPKIFQRLSLQEILGTPYTLIPILKKYSIYDVEHWKKDFILSLSDNIEKLRLVASCISYWSAKDIRKLLNSDNQNLFNVISSCRHQQMLFSKLDYSSLEFLHSSIEDDKTLLQLFCESDNLLIIKALLEKQTDANELTTKINDNALLKKLLKTKNSNLLLEKFPVYFHQIRCQRFLSMKSTSLLIQLVGKKEFFLLILKLSQGQYSLVEKNAHLIEILRNPLIYRYVAKYNLSFSDMQTHIYLFKLLFAEAKESSHIYLLSLPWDKLLELYTQNHLVHLLSIKSETLFAWVLFNVNVRPEYYQQVSREKLEMRKVNEIKLLLTSSILQDLDQFGFPLTNGFKNNFRHCDEELLRNLSVQQLLMLEKQTIENQSLLKLICSTNPCLVMMGIEQAKNTSQKINMSTFEKFFKHPIWGQLHSSFSWMLLIYFDIEFVTYLQKLTINNHTIFHLLTNENNKNIFSLLINHSKTKQLLEDKQLFKAQNPPSLYVVNKEIFFQTLLALAESTFLFKPKECEALLKKFTSEEIQYLSNFVLDSTNGKTYLDLLLQISQQTSDFEHILKQINGVENIETLTLSFPQVVLNPLIKPQLMGYSSDRLLDNRKHTLQEYLTDNHKRRKLEQSTTTEYSLSP